ncbi:MAG: ribbon-helix-helix protein, CopG family [Rhizobiales bacterium]|nr:ribbon-helix-helix protein, CopG family [Hyphomicrobiales bacterium]
MPDHSSTLAVRLPAEIASELEEISRETGRSKSYYVREAILKYLEDRADYLDAVRILEKSKGKKRIPFEQIKRELGLDD